MIKHGRIGLLAAAAVTLAVAPLSAQGYGAAAAVGDGVAFVSQPANQYAPGMVYVYRAAGANWQPAGRLAASDSTRDDGFGTALALQGNTLMVGSTKKQQGQGAVYVFTGQGTSWKQAGMLTVPGADSIGLGISIALDGDVAAVGATQVGDRQGAVYLFKRGTSGWAQDTMIQASGLAPRSNFGVSVALQGDLLVIGATGADSGTGSAYIFRKGASGWSQEARLTVPGLTRPALMGASVAIKDGYVLVGMPQAFGFAGAMAIFAHDTANHRWRSPKRLQAFDASPGGRFGTSVAFVGNEVWVGAPGADGATGAIYRMAYDSNYTVTGASKLTSDSGGRILFGNGVAVSGNSGIVTMPNADFGEGRVAALTRTGNDWKVSGQMTGEVVGLDAMTGKKRDCNGTVGIFDCKNVDLLSFLPVSDVGGGRGIVLNDLWGWTDTQGGREYAIVGRLDGTSFVDVTDPENPKYLGNLPETEGSPPSVWRDIKVYKNHAFIVADNAGEHGMQVFDLTKLRGVKSPRTFTESAHYDRIHSAHNIVINEASGYAYIVGSSGGGEMCGGGLHMVNIQNPDKPTFAGCFADAATGRAGTGYIHDAQCVTYHGPDGRFKGHEICFNASETALGIADVTNKAKPVGLSRQAYPNVGYSHQGWLTDDQKYFYMDDETDEIEGKVNGTRTIVWDVSKLDDPVVATEFISDNKASDHNLYVKGDYVYQSNYLSGLRVLDIHDRTHPVVAGYFDTVPVGEDVPGYGGTWSNYPFFKNGTVAVTSMKEGLFLVRKRETQPVP